MKKIYFSLLSLIFMLAVTPITAFAEEDVEDIPYVGTIFNERSGLPTGEANDVLQTSDGYIWVGSYGGLIRYDGTNFRNFSTEGILPSSSVRMMFEDSQGRLWIGTNDAGIFYYENGEILKPIGQPTDSFLCVRGFAEDSDGVIYACSNSGAAEIKNGEMTIYSDPEISEYTVYSLAVDGYNRVWCADSASSCKALIDGKVVHTFTGEDIFGDSGSIYSVTSGCDGEIYIGSNANLLAKVTFSTENFGDKDYEVELINTGTVSVHNSMRMMKDKTLVISGQQGIGVLYADKRFREFSPSEGADSVNSAFIDYEQNVWLASSSKGIVRFSAGCYSNPNVAAGLDGVTINAIAIADGYRYLGTGNNLLIYDANWNEVKNELTEIYSENKIRIRHLISDSKGRIWIAAYDSSYPLVRYDPKSKEIFAFTMENGLASDRVRVLLPLSDGRIAVGTHNSVSIISENTVEKTYTDFEYPTILSLLETEDSLLAGSDGGGIYEIKGDEIINHGFSEGLSEGVVLRMLKDSEGDGYFISAGSSLYYWENNEFKKLTEIEKEPGSIFDFYQSGDTIWLLQNNGILASSREDILAGGTGKPVTYSFAYGLTGSLNANTWHAMEDGKLFLATRNGVSIFNFKEPEHALPKIIINSVTIDGETYEHPETIEIPNTAQRVTIDFAALSFTDTTPVSIAYRLEGFEDNETILNVKSSSVSYTNLPGGSYSFKLRTFINDDEDSSISLDAVKEKRLKEKPLFWIIVVIFGVAVVAAFAVIIANARIAAAKKRQQEYRDILEQSLLTFAGTIDAKDKYTNGHSRRVAEYSRELAKRMGFSEEQQEHIYYVALLHDIGKIGIPDSILNKPGKLTEEERKIIETHPAVGAEILKNFTALEGISEGAKYHHERYDGSGYNEGISGEDIPIFARIIGVADTYDAMSSERCYRKPLSLEIIISELEKSRGTQLDPDIVLIMLEMIDENVVPFK